MVAQEEYQATQEEVNEQAGINDEPSMKTVQDTYLLYHFNNVGSTTAITDQNGTVKYQYQYSSYGELIAGTYGQVAFLYNGKYGVASDDNGLYYMRARYYNSSIKRFINQDVVIGSIERSGSLNRYAYVEGNPVSYIEPFGMEPETVEANGKTWYKHDSGLFLYIPGQGSLKIKNSIDFLDKTRCLMVAYEIASDGLIKGMSVVSIAAEIYFHVAVWLGLYPSQLWNDDTELKAKIKDKYRRASETDLEDGGDKRTEVRNAMWAVWYGTIPYDILL